MAEVQRSYGVTDRFQFQ